MPEPPADLRAALADRYTIERELGRGGMATVYLARDLKHGRDVALKVLRSEVAAALGADRFEREIEIAARLNHPHILPLHESGAAAGFLYYVMPYAEGESLRDRIQQETQLSLEDALQITREVADALTYAHSQGVIHRDIKPENILLIGGHAVVADFGIARALSAAGGEALTQTGLALGTPAYMSPEQGSGSRAVDARSDLYSLACVLYEMLAGHPPFMGSTAQEVFARHALDPVPSLRTGRRAVPEAVEHATIKALAKVPADRYLSVAQFANALAGASSDPGAPARPRPGMRVRHWVVVAGLGSAAVLLLSLGFKLLGPRPPAEHSGNARQVRSLVVLPLENRSGDSTLGAEITEALVTDLRRIRPLRVIRPKGVTRKEATTESIQEIARGLGADGALEGQIHSSGDTLLVDLQLISATTGNRLWVRRFAEPLEKRLAIEDAMVRGLVAALELSVTPSEERRLGTPPTSNAEAWDLFLRAKIHLRTETPIEEAIAVRLFEQAVALDPDFATGYAWMAYAHGLSLFYEHPDQNTFEQAMVAAEKALRLGPDLAEAHFARAFLLWTPAAHFAHEQAIQEFHRANELNPNLPEAHDWLAVVYWHIGLLDQAAEEFRQALAIDPGNRVAQDRKTMILVYRGQYEEAVRVLRPIPRDYNPSLATYNFVWALALAGRIDEASTVIEDYLRNNPADRGGVVTGVRAILRAKAGDRPGAEADIKRAERLGQGFGHFHHTAYSIASAYALLRQPGPAVEWLRRTIDDGLPCYPLLASDPTLNSLRQDPGFVALLAELKTQWERWTRTL